MLPMLIVGAFISVMAGLAYDWPAGLLTLLAYVAGVLTALRDDERPSGDRRTCGHRIPEHDCHDCMSELDRLMRDM